ncbi:MAG: hypothetical protein AAGA99_15840 [Actinomycetota bacterium]
MSPIVATALITLAASVLATLIVLLSWRFRPGVWAADVGLEPREPVAGAVVFVVLVLVLLGGAIAASVVAIDEYGLVGAAVAGWSVMVVFGLWDFLVIDWLIFIGLRPSWFHLDGMEESTHVYDWRHHAKESLPALAFGVPMAAVSTGAAALLT